jgi:hypothetical protein
VKHADDTFYVAPNTDSLISAMSSVIEGGISRLMKFAVPLLLDIQNKVG